MLTAVRYIATHLYIAQWNNINNRINHFLDYAATHPYAKVTYHNINIHLWVNTNAFYLNKPKSISRAVGYHYSSNKLKLPIQSDNPPPKHNHRALFLRKLIDDLMSSTQESETGSGYVNAKESLTFPISIKKA